MRYKYGLFILLLAAFIVRLIYGLSQEPTSVFENQGNDSWLYLQMGHNLVSGFDYSEISLPTAPLYLIFNGVWQQLLPGASAIIAIRITQALLSTAICFFAYRLSYLISGSLAAGFVTLTALAVSPIFILEAALIVTETLYIFLLTAGLWLYTELQVRPQKAHWTWFALDGALFGLATLTRAVMLVFPLGLMIHLWLVNNWRVALRRSAALLLVYVCVVSTWTVHNLVHWNRFVIAAEGFAAFLYIGATDWEGPEQVDRNLVEDAGIEGELPSDVGIQQEIYRQATTNVISSDPLGYVFHRVGDLLGAYAQPHGTLLFGGAGIKELVGGWLQADRTVSGLINLTTAPGFWPKLALYGFHYAGLLLGLIGMWLLRRRWRLILPLIGFIVYTTLLHLVLDAIPRYIFPTMVIWWVFAGVTLSSLWTTYQQRKLLQLSA
ncbi:MAG: hypothetical protein CL610_26985 [Anaerolineaceae bacterium]|nr:hypothetical protein [Anaerolineaceae bacterium]